MARDPAFQIIRMTGVKGAVAATEKICMEGHDLRPAGARVLRQAQDERGFGKTVNLDQ
ncbi:hypothetical protein [Sphingobium sp. TomMM35A]